MSRAYTLLEILITLFIVAILSTLFFASFEKARRKAETVQCGTNLKSLHVGTCGYMQDHSDRWPQIKLDAGGNSTTELQRVGKEWRKALLPYGIQLKGWICPTLQRQLRTDLTKEKNERCDYFATPFGPKPRAAYAYSTQPWFVEAANAHTRGNLMLFMDGSIKPMFDFVAPPK